MEVKEEKDNEEFKINMEKQAKLINKMLVGLIIVIIIATVLLVYYQKIRYEEYYFEYNDYPIHKVRQENLDVYQIEVISNGRKVLLTSRNSPVDLEDISFDANFNHLFSKKEIYVTMSANATGVSVVAATEIGKIIGNPNILETPIRTMGALIDSVDGKEITVKTCSDSSTDVGIIELRHGAKNKIYNEGECIILEGVSEYDFLKLANRLTFTLVGIMNTEPL